MSTEIRKLINTALERNELSELLMGVQEYRFIPKYSSSPYETDLPSILSEIYAMCNNDNLVEWKFKLEHALQDISDKYDGIIPTAIIILSETLNIFNNEKIIGLCLDKFAKNLNKSIMKFQDRLLYDDSFAATEYSDGLFGELRRLNRIVISKGGPPFL